MAELKAKGTCDFCGEACNADMRGAKAYDCEDFAVPTTGTMSYGAWGACPSCAGLIDGEDWDALEKRMTEAQRGRFGFLAEQRLPELRQMHTQQIQLFRQHRIDAGTTGLKGKFGDGRDELMTPLGPLNELMAAERGLMTRRTAFPHAKGFIAKQGVS